MKPYYFLVGYYPLNIGIVERRRRMALCSDIMVWCKEQWGPAFPVGSWSHLSGRKAILALKDPEHIVMFRMRWADDLACYQDVDHTVPL